VDPNVPIEDAMRTLVGFVREGKFDHIGLSECAAETLRRANTVCLSRYAVVFESVTVKLLKVHPIAAVEIEISPWSYEDETKKGMIRNIFLRHVLTVISNSHCNGEGARCCRSSVFVS
jgi:pyridoxine 4-dehydrogenase